MKGLKTTPQAITLPKPPKLPMGTPKGGGGAMGKAISAGFGTKHKLRHGTEFPGMDTIDTGVADQMSDYARMKAAGGM